MTEDRMEFLEEGMKKYQEATNTLIAFGNEVETELQSILKKRKRWGKFIQKDEIKTKSTKFWNMYPHHNAWIKGTYEEEEFWIVLSVSWYNSESNYPFYQVQLKPDMTYSNELEEFNWTDGFEFKENGLRFYPNPDSFDIERDFNIFLPSHDNSLNNLPIALHFFSAKNNPSDHFFHLILFKETNEFI
jgi:hypothetical protein